MDWKCVIWQTPLKGVERHYNTFSFKDIINEGPCVWEIESDRSGPLYRIYNPRAGGKYRTNHQSFSINYFTKKEEKIQLSAHIAKENLKNRTPALDSLMKDDNWLEKLPPVPDNPSKKVEILLKGLTTLYPKSGERIPMDLSSILNGHSDPIILFLYALAYCSDETEFKFLIDSLKDSKDVKIEGDYIGGQNEMSITEKGWQRIKTAEQKTPHKQSNQGFIAMWLDPVMDELNESIKKAVKNAGYKPLRIDEKLHSNKIDDEILSEIEKSRFIICDLTSSGINEPRGSVYFGAGYAKGKRIPVIWTCRDDMEKAQAESFDTRQYKCLFWNKDNMRDFEKILQKHIEENKNIGRGPL